MIKPQPLPDARRIIEALNVPVAVVMARKASPDVAGAALEYYAVSKGFDRIYGAMFETLMGFESHGPKEWRGLCHTDMFPVLQEPGHEWAVQLMGALKGDSTGWTDVAWNTEEPGIITVAYQLTAVAPGWAAVEAVDIAGHAARILGNGVDHA